MTVEGPPQRRAARAPHEDRRDDMEITDKVIVLTGASSGIGRATAMMLADQGARVVLAARDAAALEDLRQQLPGSEAMATDVTDPDQAGALIERVEARFGSIDALVNCAGQGMFSRVEGIDLDDLDRLWDLNVVAPLRLMQLVIPIMRRQGGGTILNVSSLSTTRYIPHIAGYAATKYALNALTLAGRAELEDDGIVVSLIRPGIVDTGFGDRATTPEPDALRHGPDGGLLPHVISTNTVAERIVDLFRSGAAEVNITEP